MLIFSYEIPFQKDLEKRNSNIRNFLTQKNNGPDFAYGFGEDEINMTFFLKNDGKELFINTYNGEKIVGVTEVIFHTLFGFINTIKNLESGKNNVQHMFLDGSGYLRIKKNDKKKITIQYEDTSYEILNSFHAVLLWEWYFAVADLGYQIIVFFDNNGIETKKLTPFLALKRDLDKLMDKSKELSKTSYV